MLTIIGTLAIIGLLVWLICLIPKPPIFNQAIILVALLFAILYLCQALGHPIGPRINLW